MPYADQLEAKRRHVAQELSRHLQPGGFAPVLPTLPSAKTEGYRATAKLSVARGPEGPRIGLYRRGSHDVIDLRRCEVHHPLVGAGVRALRNLLSRAPGLTAFGPGAGGWLRYAAFQASVTEQRLLITLVTRDEARGEVLRSLAARLRERSPGLLGVVRNVNPTGGNEIFGDQWEEIWGEGFIRDRVGELTVRASAGSFLQVNREQAARAYEEAMEGVRVDPGELALDLFCGVGALSLHLAARGARVVGVDVSSRAIGDARATARDQGFGNASFRVGRVEDELPRLLGEGFRPEVATLNPARKGLDEAAVAALRSVRPRALSYLSCDPVTLARDAAALCEGGAYRIERIQPLDFFPHTGHVETVAVFRSTRSSSACS